jgi:hypothetical protein
MSDFFAGEELRFALDFDEPVRFRPEDDAIVRLLGRENRLALQVSRVATVPVPERTSRVGKDVAMALVLHAHPECQFVWCRIIVDLDQTSGAVIADMSPRGVEDVAVEVSTAVSAGLRFSVIAEAVNLSLAPEMRKKRNIFMPTVATSGVGFRKGYWDFLAKGGDYLHIEQELRLLIDAPPDRPLIAGVSARAKVRVRGLGRVIPLTTRKVSAGLELEYPTASSDDGEPNRVP